MSMLTRFEATRLLSARALQISLGAPPLIKVKGELNPFQIAKQELADKVLPLSVIRSFPNGEKQRVEIN